MTLINAVLGMFRSSDTRDAITMNDARRYELVLHEIHDGGH